MPDYDYVVVDTFASGPFTGNPAGVVLDASRLSDQAMQAIAREINLTETAFLLPSTKPDAAIRVRTFSPTAEAAVSGHSILAGVSALLNAGRFMALLDEPGTRLPIQTRSGVASARAEITPADDHAPMVWVLVSNPLLKQFKHDPTKTGRLLGVDPAEIDEAMPAMTTRDNDVILFVRTYQALMEATPDFGTLAGFSRRRGVRTWCVATLETLTPSVHAHSRCFAPAAGINEDAVTLSVHGPLAVYLVIAEQVGIAKGRAAVACTQSDATGRAGLVRALVDHDESGAYQAWIGGRCCQTLAGQVSVSGAVGARPPLRDDPTDGRHE